MKKFVSFVCAACFCVALVGCSGNDVVPAENASETSGQQGPGLKQAPSPDGGGTGIDAPPPQ